jgi:hypothetical protein
MIYSLLPAQQRRRSSTGEIAAAKPDEPQRALRIGSLFVNHPLFES